MKPLISRMPMEAPTCLTADELERIADLPPERQQHLNSCPTCQALVERASRFDPHAAAALFARQLPGRAPGWPALAASGALAALVAVLAVMGWQAHAHGDRELQAF